MDNNINSSLMSTPLSTVPNTDANTDANANVPIVPAPIPVPAGGHIAIIASIFINVIVIGALSFMIYYFGIPTINDKLMMAEAQRQDEINILNKAVKDMMSKAKNMEEENKAQQSIIEEHNKMQSIINANTTDMASTSTKVIASSTTRIIINRPSK